MASASKTAPAAKKDVFSIPTQQLRFRCTGISPLLMNNPEAMLKQRGNGGPKVGGRAIPTPEVEAENGAYRDGDGLIFPTAAFRNCLLSGAKPMSFKPSGRGRAISFKTFLSGLLFAVGERVKLEQPNGTRLGPLDYEVSVMRAVPPGQGAVLRARPMVRQWACDVTFEYLTEYVGVAEEFATSVLEAFRRAGLTVGVGNYRPEKNGPFGRYNVELLA